MTNENNNRIDGQNDQKTHSPEFVKEQIKNSGSYKLIPVKGKSKMPVRKLSLQQEKQLVASKFVKALKPLLFITYRFTCEKVSYYRCAMQHVLHWISGVPPNLVIDYSKVLVACGNRFNTERAVAK